MLTLQTNLAGVLLKNCFIAGSGSMTQQKAAIIKWIDEGFAAVVPKTVAPDGCECNDPPDAWIPRESSAGKAAGGIDYNCEGITRLPLARNVQLYRSAASDRPDGVLFLSVLGLADSRQSWEDCILPFTGTVKFVEANVSCPQNVIEKGAGAVIGRDPVLLRRVVGWLKEICAKLGVPFSVKLTPSSDVVNMARVAAGEGCDALTCFNTYPGNLGFDPSSWNALPNTASRQGFGTNGAISGRAIHNISLEYFRQVAEVMRKEAPHVALIASGGVEDVRTALNYLFFGAAALQVYSALKPGLCQMLCAELLASMDAHGKESLDQLRGIGFEKFLGSSALVERVGGQGADGFIPPKVNG